MNAELANDPFYLGYEAARMNQVREPPAYLNEEEKTEWLMGYDEAARREIDEV